MESPDPCEPPHPAPWPTFAPGERLIVVKRSPDGSEAARYPGTVVFQIAGGSWLVVHATWTHRKVELDGLAFCPGDDLLEWFSPTEHFNVFAVHAPTGHLRGWYANVTYPPRLDVTVNPPILEWHDLFVDLVGFPNGTFTIRDEDELSASELARHDPHIYSQIVAARDELVSRFRRGVSPFVDGPKIAV